MKTIIKLLVVLAACNAVARSAQAAWSYYQFKDAAAQTILFGTCATTGQLHAQILEKAMELELPLQAEDLAVRRTRQRTIVKASYVQPVELFPSYRYPAAFSFSIDSVATTGLKADP